MKNIEKFNQILIVGYGVSGKSVFNFLTKRGFCVSVYDDQISSINNKVLDGIELIIKSPSIPIMKHNCHTIIKEAQNLNIPIISTFDVFRLCNPDAKIIAITGTNGKSTTTALIYHILKNLGVSISIGGNIGIPYFEMPKSDWYVLEMSSYELESSKYLDFELACVINIEPDHLGFHGTFENYVQSKHKALDNAKIRFISSDDKITYDAYKDKDNVIIISSANTFDNVKNLIGKHNHQNISFACEICKQFGFSSQEIFDQIMTFKPLSHRINQVRVINNILFVNDSKATNPGSSARALDTFSEYKIYWLVGGRSKKTDPMPYIKDYLPSVQKIYLFGESMQEFEKIFKDTKEFVKCETMQNALNVAFEDAKHDGLKSVILLSPMCASFDQFDNFEQRGEIFEKLVKDLKDE